MFDNLRQAFREAVDNFKEEIRREDVPETVDKLLRGMKAEVADKKAYVAGLEADIEKTLKRVAREKKNTETAIRRQKLAVPTSVTRRPLGLQASTPRSTPDLSWRSSVKQRRSRKS